MRCIGKMAEVTEKKVTISEDAKDSDGPEGGPKNPEGSSPERDAKAGRGKRRQVKKVMLAVDGSPASNQAVEWYLTEMHKKRNTVVFLHSFELPMMHSYQEMSGCPEMWAQTLKHEADRTATMEKHMLRKLKVHEIEGKFLARGGGKPGEAILSVAEEEDVDLIIMGTRGHGRLMRALLGSVSHYVMSHAHCPVLVYRQKKNKEPRSRSRSASPGRKNKNRKERKGSDAEGEGKKAEDGQKQRKKSESGDEKKGKKDGKED